MIHEMRHRVELETLEPLRIGGVEDPLTGIHNPVARVGDKLVVPGSSLKGALRAEVERYLIDTYYDGGGKRWPPDKQALQPCIPATKFTPDEQGLIKAGKYRADACHYPCDIIQERDRVRGKCVRDGRPTPHGICPVCYLFGAMGLNGFVRVPFLYSELAAEELYSARMDRARSTVVEGTNRPYQLIRAGVRFSGDMTVVVENTLLGWKLGQPRPLENHTKGDEWLKAASREAKELLKEFVEGRLQGIGILGGYKSKGFGSVKITVKPA